MHTATYESNKLFNKNFSIISIGQLISLLGNSLQRFSLSLLILDLTSSAFIFSLITALTFIPQILLAPFGGAIADRFSKKWIMVILDTISACILLFYFVYSKTTSCLSPLLISLLMFVLTIIYSIYDPTVRASIPTVTHSDHLSQANSVVTIISSSSNILGPIGAGFLYSLYGIQIIFLINTISFLFSALMELFLNVPCVKTEINKNLLVTFVEDIIDTFKYLVHEKTFIIRVIIFTGCFNLFLAPIYSVGIPYMEKIVFRVNNELYGLSEALVGIGTILGALLTRRISEKWDFMKSYNYFYAALLLILGMGCCGLPVMLLTEQSRFITFSLFTLLSLLYALCMTVVSILSMTFIQSQIPSNYMGKSMALVMALSNTLFPLGQLIYGWLYDTFATIPWAIYLLAGVSTLMITLTLQYSIRKAIQLGEVY